MFQQVSPRNNVRITTPEAPYKLNNLSEVTSPKVSKIDDLFGSKLLLTPPIEKMVSDELSSTTKSKSTEDKNENSAGASSFEECLQGSSQTSIV